MRPVTASSAGAHEAKLIMSAAIHRNKFMVGHSRLRMGSMTSGAIAGRDCTMVSHP
jgi:hypothetical protein